MDVIFVVLRMQCQEATVTCAEASPIATQLSSILNILPLELIISKIFKFKDMAQRTSKRIRRQLQRQAEIIKKRKLSATSESAGKSDSTGKSGYKTAPTAEVLPDRMPIPTRNKNNELVFKDHPEFRPNLTPKEVLNLGSFGGTYFRRIRSSVTNETYSGVYKEFPKDWFENLDIKKQVTSAKYQTTVNRYKVKCGGDLHMWESSGWISNIDPYGWFQWYCRFYLGRRSTDDDRQIKRGLGVCGPKGRFRNQLIGRCARNGKKFDDSSISPVIRQALQHWGYQLTKKDADAYVRKKKLPKLP